MGNKTILQVNTLDKVGGGGAANIAWNLFEEYKKMGCKSYLVVGDKKADHQDVFQIPKNFPTNFFKKVWLYAKNKHNPLKQRFYGTKKLLSLAPNKPNILHLHNLHGDYFDLNELPKISHKIPTIITMHDAWLLSGHCAHSFDCEKWVFGCKNCPDLTIYPALKYNRTSYLWRKKKNLYKKSKLYVATPCKWLMNKVDKSILLPGIAQKKVIPNGVDISLFKPGNKVFLRKKLNFPAYAFVMLFVGHGTKNNPWKDYKTLEKALKLVSKKIILLCVGETGKTKKINNIEIRFIPYQKDKNKIIGYFQLADVYVHPAKAETFPNVILEALACGLPVVATDVGGISEQISDSTGILVKAQPSTKKKDENELVKAINFMHDNPIIREKMSLSARATAVAKFSLSQQVKSYLDWYEEILCSNQKFLQKSQ
jgi:glycosyltransferase involved in cell wall biosynthesis